MWLNFISYQIAGCNVELRADPGGWCLETSNRNYCERKATDYERPILIKAVANISISLYD